MTFEPCCSPKGYVLLAAKGEGDRYEVLTESPTTLDAARTLAETWLAAHPNGVVLMALRAGFAVGETARRGR